MGNARKTKLSEGYGFDSPLAARIRDLIEETTQEKLANHCGVSRQAVALWKDGKTKPDATMISTIADFFHTTADYILCRTDVRSTDVDKAAVCAYTGLTEQAISVILTARRMQEYRQEEEKPDIMGALNALLSDQQFFLLSLHISLYRQDMAKAVEPKGETEEESLQYAMSISDLKTAADMQRFRAIEQFVEILNRMK